MKKSFAPYLVALLCTGIILLIHIIPVSNSVINYQEDGEKEKYLISESYTAYNVWLHKTHPVFLKRPVTTLAVEGMVNWFHISIGKAFVFISFSMFFICGLLLYHLSNVILKDPLAAIWSMMAFYLSYSILFAYFPSLYTYDEPFQYAFILLGMVGIVKRQWTLYIFSFSAGLIARENGLLLLPSIGLLLFGVRFESKALFSKFNIRRSLILIVPVVVYFIYSAIIDFRQADSGKEYLDSLERHMAWQYNFQNLQFAVESLISLFQVLAIPVYLTYWYLRREKPDPMENKLIRSFIICVIVNTIVIFVATRARESRLFALPLLFLWPILGKIILTEVRYLRSKLNLSAFFSDVRYVSALAALTALSFLIMVFGYLPTGSDNAHSFQDEYFLLTLLFISFHFMAMMFIGRAKAA